MSERRKEREQVIVRFFSAIAAYDGSEVSLSVEIAEACWWLLLRSATPRDAKFVAARAIAPTEQRGYNSLRLVPSECAGGLKGADGDYFVRRLMSGATASGGLRA